VPGVPDTRGKKGDQKGTEPNWRGGRKETREKCALWGEKQEKGGVRPPIHLQTLILPWLKNKREENAADDSKSKGFKTE